MQENNENVCWPMSGSGEIDIFEHYGNNGQNGFAARGIKNLGYCDGGDWFMILNYALNSSMAGGYEEYAMEIDWARHEY